MGWAPLDGICVPDAASGQNQYFPISSVVTLSTLLDVDETTPFDRWLGHSLLN